MGGISDSERGAIAIEYAFLFVLVFLAAIVAVAVFGSAVVELYTDNNNQFSAATQRSAG